MAFRSVLRHRLLSLDLRLGITQADNSAISCLLSSQGPQEQLLSLRALFQFPQYSSTSSKVSMTVSHALHQLFCSLLDSHNNHNAACRPVPVTMTALIAPRRKQCQMRKPAHQSAGGGGPKRLQARLKTTAAAQCTERML